MILSNVQFFGRIKKFKCAINCLSMAKVNSMTVPDGDDDDVLMLACSTGPYHRITALTFSLVQASIKAAM